eukprot:TRINITY_DN11362_c0_g2_i2.p1 TRINITY_DN11362_c0_g2~~TRINITY_DN11362_c0_g2_i2.p1  ORF type:complete len:517 (-),score=105.56 TRINITY_DN11362_c0_g2_i2:79-1629(-)
MEAFLLFWGRRHGLPMALVLFMGAFELVDAGNAFLGASDVSVEEADRQLEAEIDGKASAQRLAEFKELFLPLYNAMPKDARGHLNHGYVRYSLHRLLSKRRGWFAKGLEPDRDVKNASNLTEWVPSYLMHHLEATRGIGAQEVAAIAATIEDLVRKETIGRMKAIFEIHGFPLNSTFNATFADALIDTYALIYHKKEGKWEANSSQDAWRRVQNFKHNYKSGWPKLSDFLRAIRRNLTGSDESHKENGLGIEQLSAIAIEFGNQYFSSYNLPMCNEMKAELTSLEDHRPGRVLLSAFYKKAMAVRRWGFTEKFDYLRTLGALDESDPERPRVIIPNYVGSRPQCMEASRYYAICCISECEALLSELEQAIAQPTATAEKILELVSALPSATVAAPRELPHLLRSRLEGVAAMHSGRVPLYGRLFAQWMHHAYPRECPYPHESGTISPQSPDEWTESTGKDYTATDEEMGCHVHGDCAGGAAALDAAAQTVGAAPPEDSSETSDDIPWTDSEEFAEL